MGKVDQSRLRAIPSVEKLLQALGPVDLPRPTLVAVVRREVKTLRRVESIPDFETVLSGVRTRIELLRRTRIQPVINATGIIVHTNLGRSPLGAEVVQSLESIGANYSNLEFDLAAGTRGERAAYLEHNLALLCGAEAATVTNNCAAALVLILRHFCSGERNEVIISRGELVQIGGGFRIPEILEGSGARLREAGTTNKTSLNDYSRAIRKETGMILKVHRSNFFMGGFVESPGTEELAKLARAKGVPLVEDLGSGAVIQTDELGEIEHEPTPAEVVGRGVDLVCFSGDKLLGGPQAGIIAGKAKWVAAMKREPFFRALRCDKLILAALQTTVDLYLSGRAREQVPILRMLSASPEELQIRGNRILAALEELPVKASLAPGKAQAGGGSLPRSVMPSVVLAIQPEYYSLEEFSTRLRSTSPPVVGYVAGNRYRLDLRTVFPGQDHDLIRAIQQAAAPGE